MSTHAMLIQSLKHKAQIFKLSILLVALSFLSGCFGDNCGITNPSTGEFIPCPSLGVATSNTNVIYNLPTNGGAYNLTGNNGKTIFQPSVTFPDGLPAKASGQVVIRLNGTDITSEFNSWGANEASVTLPINNTNTPKIWGTIRDGRNTFQVLEPYKQLISFDLDLTSARVHIIGVDDGWNGVQDFPQRGNVLVGGFVEGDGYANVTSMQVKIYGINATTGLRYPLAGNGTDMTASMGTTVSGGGQFYLSLGSDQANTLAKALPLGGFEDALNLHASYAFTANGNDGSGRGLNLTGSGGTFSSEGLTLTTGSNYQSVSTDALNSDYHTISFYIRFNSGPDANWRKIFAYNAGGSDRSPGIWKHPNQNTIHWRYDPTNGGSSETFTYNVGQFYHVKGVKQGSNLYIYVDDVLVDSGTVPNPKVAGNATLWFGGAPVTLRDFRVYSTVPVPAGAKYEYGFAPPRWTLTGGSGIAAEGSNFNVTNTPEGTQALFLQKTGTATREFTIRDNKSYKLRFHAAQRNTNAQQVGVYLDGVLLGNVQPPNSNFTLYEYDLGVIEKGPHELEFRGLTPVNQDHTAFIDDVALWATPLSSNGFAFNAYDGNDAAIVEITVCDTEGCAPKRWLRSTVPIYDGRLKNEGGFSIAFDQIALKSTAAEVENILEATVIGDAIRLGQPGHNHANDLSVSESGIDVTVHHLSFGNAAVNLETRVAQYASEPLPASPRSTLYVDANLTSLRTDIRGINDCTISMNSIRFTSGLEFWVNKDDPQNPYTDFAWNNPGANLDIPGLGVSGGFASGCNLVGGLLGLFQGIILDVATGIIDDVIRGIFQNDLPRLRLATTFGRDQRICDPGEVPFYGDSQCALFGPSYLALRPQLSDFFGLRNHWIPSGHTNWDVRYGLNLGMHTTGQNANRIPALGSLYNDYVMDPARTSFSLNNTSDEYKANARTIGATLTENWLNQVMLGLWESGILYFDFEFGGVPPEMTPLLDDVVFQFTSAQPWEFDMLPTDDPRGDVLLTIPDLTIAFIADVYFPDYRPEYTFAYMVADVQLYLDLSIAPGDGALRIQSASSVEITVQSIYSDWDGTTERQMINLFDEAITYLTGAGAWDIPFPEILGSEVEFGDLWSDEGQLSVTIDVYNGAIYPMGPGSKMTAVTAYNGSQSSGSYDSLQNGLDDTAGNSFHFSARGRSNARSCTGGTNFWGTCQGYTYYWTENPFDWGFGFKTIRLQNITSIGIDRRNDCCDTRANNIRIRLYKNGALQWTSPPTSGSGTGISTVAVPNILADEVRLMVLKTGANCAAFNTTSCQAGDWNGNNVNRPDGLGVVGDGGKTMNFSEVILTIN